MSSFYFDRFEARTPYEPVPDWPRPLADLPGHADWTWGAVQGIFAESPDRVFLLMRGELPRLERPPEVRYDFGWIWQELGLERQRSRSAAGGILCGAAWLMRGCLGRPRVNFELHAIDFLDASDGLDDLAPHQPDVRVRSSQKRAAFSAAIDVLRRAEYRFVTLDEAAGHFM